MNQTNNTIIDSMNISSDAIIINQCDRNGKRILHRQDNNIEFWDFNERGVGLSRNSALMRSTADIVEFADDDMIFTDTYKEDVLLEFQRHPEADAILFSVESLNSERPLLRINKFARVSRREALKYGCARLAVRREKILYHNIYFSLLFGGGARYGSGEDTLFLQDCIKAGMKVYKSDIKVADIRQDESSWFHGYTQKYYEDKGALFAAIFPYISYLYALASTLKSCNKDFQKREILLFYKNGIRKFNAQRRGNRYGK